MKPILTAMVVMLLSVAAHADSLQTEGLWARATVPGGTTAAVYGVIVNSTDEQHRIVSIETERASKSTIHRTMMEDGMMKMRHVGSMTIDAGDRLEFEPGGLHIMLTGIAEPLREGDEFELTLLLADGTSVSLPVTVGTIGQMSYPDD